MGNAPKDKRQPEPIRSRQDLEADVSKLKAALIAKAKDVEFLVQSGAGFAVYVYSSATKEEVREAARQRLKELRVKKSPDELCDLIGLPRPSRLEVVGGC